MYREVPPGFAPHLRSSPLLEPWAPLFSRTLSDRLILGLHVRKPHLNGRGAVHGGLFAALADQAMGLTCALKLQNQGYEVTNLWTSSLTIDYLANARPRQWLAFDTAFAHVGKTLCQAEIDITADGETVARGRGAFRAMLARLPVHASSSS